ncbi:MAG: hypothetical protein R2813_02575 [Flavobacteriales bacterium]
MVFKLTQYGQLLDTLIQGYNVGIDNRNDRPLDIIEENDTVYITGYTETYGHGGKEAFMTVLSADLKILHGSTTFGTTSDQSRVILRMEKV